MLAFFRSAVRDAENNLVSCPCLDTRTKNQTETKTTSDTKTMKRSHCSSWAARGQRGTAFADARGIPTTKAIAISAI